MSNKFLKIFDNSNIYLKIVLIIQMFDAFLLIIIYYFNFLDYLNF